MKSGCSVHLLLLLIVLHQGKSLNLGSSPRSQRTNNKALLQKAAEKEVVDVCVCGAGPAGLLLASNLAKQPDVKTVAVVDPALDRPWPNNYGVWMDEAIHFGFGDCVSHTWKEVAVDFDESTPGEILQRPYGRVDRIKMKARLMSECTAGGVVFGCAKAVHLEHFDDLPSQVTIQTIGKDGKDKTVQQAVVQALMVVDATGFSRQFVEHEVNFDPGFQVTYGARFRVSDLGPYQLDRMCLMDYSEMHLHDGDDPKLVKSNDRFPSFVYAMPLAADELFLEETILVSRPAGSSRDLQARLMKRMDALGVQAIQVLEEERAAIPMGGADPLVPQRTLGFGATSSLVHPASGYMVARAMEVAPRVAAKLAPEIRRLRTKLKEGSLDKEAFDRASAAGWWAIWPPDERRQRDFMHFGFELLCLLNPQELRDFFTGFFRLPSGLWEHFLSWRLSGIGHIVMGVILWATCIPRRFMPTMLIKSLPFLADKLVLPFATRGSPLFSESVYWDARSGNSTLWEPESYFPYLNSLSERR